MAVIFDKQSKFSLIRQVENPTAKLVVSTTIELLRPDKDRVLAVTAERGQELAYHQKVTKALEGNYYFAHLYSFDPTGRNENSNGLIHQF